MISVLLGICKTVKREIWNSLRDAFEKQISISIRLKSTPSLETGGQLLWKRYKMCEKVDDLEERLNDILPEPDEDGIWGDGSYKHYANLFERAYEKADSIAREAISMLKNRDA
jgi:hypothetical protein